MHFPLTACVYPAPETGAAAAAGAAARASIRNARRAPPMPSSRDLREYQRGDPLQRVAWKAVARGAGWYTKQFEGGGGGGPLDLDWAELPPALDAEARLSRLTAWVLAAERATRAVRAARCPAPTCRTDRAPAIAAPR